MNRRHLGAVFVATVMLAGCASEVIVAQPELVPTPPPTASATTAESLDAFEPDAEEGIPAEFVAQPQTSPEKLTCDDEPLAFAFGLVNAATGHRLLGLSMRNCSKEDIRIDELAFTGVDSMLREHNLSAEPLKPRKLAPDQEAQIEVEWLSNGRCERGIQRLTLTVAGQTHTREDCFQMGGSIAPGRDPLIGLRWM